MTVNRKTCQAKHDFRKRPRTGRRSFIEPRDERPASHPLAGGLTLRLDGQTFAIPSVHARTREETERLAWNVKQIFFDRGVIRNLG